MWNLWQGGCSTCQRRITFDPDRRQRPGTRADRGHSQPRRVPPCPWPAGRRLAVSVHGVPVCATPVRCIPPTAARLELVTRGCLCVSGSNHGKVLPYRTERSLLPNCGPIVHSWLRSDVTSHGTLSCHGPTRIVVRPRPLAPGASAGIVLHPGGVNDRCGRAPVKRGKQD